MPSLSKVDRPSQYPFAYSALVCDCWESELGGNCIPVAIHRCAIMNQAFGATLRPCRWKTLFCSTLRDSALFPLTRLTRPTRPLPTGTHLTIPLRCAKWPYDPWHSRGGGHNSLGTVVRHQPNQC